MAGLFKKIRNKVKNTISGVQDKEKHFRDQVSEKIREGLEKANLSSVLDIPYRVLLPFRKVMSDALNRRQIPHNGTISDISDKFHQYVVKRSGSYNSIKANGVDGDPNDNEKGTPIVSGSGVVDSSGRVRGAMSADAKDYEAGAKQTMNIVQMILQWFKDRKEAKKNKEAITPEESDMVDEADATTEALTKEAEKEVEKDSEFSTTEIVLTLLAVCIVLYLVLGGKKKVATA